MKLRLLLIPVLILLAPLVSAYTAQEIDNAVIVAYLPSAIDADDSPYSRTGTNSGFVLSDTTKKLGSYSAYSDASAGNSVTFSDDTYMNTMQNLTVLVWSNYTDTNPATEYIVARRDADPGVAGDWAIMVHEATGLEKIQAYYWYNTDTVVGLYYDPTAPSPFYVNSDWELVWLVVNFTGGNVYAYLGINDTVLESSSTASSPLSTSSDIVIGDFPGNTEYTGGLDDLMLINLSLSTDDISEHIWNNGDGAEYPLVSADTTPPEIDQDSYNMTSEGGAGCISWRTNKATACSTGDTTPTVNFTTTNDNAWCAIGKQDINFSDYNALGVNRNCTLGQGTKSHTCTLYPVDELVYEDSEIYISCQDSSGNENLTSSSGALSLQITSLEAGSESAIETGIQNALLSGYTIYSNQQIYARKLDGTQDTGTFDKVAKKGSKVWAFNHITKGEQHVGLFNLTPVLYVLEMANITNSTIINSMELMINATK